MMNKGNVIKDKTTEESKENNENVKYSKIAGILLIIVGVGVPGFSWIMGSAQAGKDNVFLGLVAMGILFIPIWILPIIGGVFAIKREKYCFVLFSSVITLLYWIPFYIVSEDICFHRPYHPGETILYVVLLIISIVSFVLVLDSKKEYL
jgi:hypothetical protein